jgi:hypothetical protein
LKCIKYRYLHLEFSVSNEVEENRQHEKIA